MTTEDSADGNDPGNGRAARATGFMFRGNPRPGLDYIVMLEGRIPPCGHRVRLAYVPDKLLLAEESFEAYMAAVDLDSRKAVEGLAFAMLDAINNEIVPRWAQVVIAAAHDDADVCPQRVIVEDRQPNWDNPHILAHLQPW